MAWPTEAPEAVERDVPPAAKRELDCARTLDESDTETRDDVLVERAECALRTSEFPRPTDEAEERAPVRFTPCETELPAELLRDVLRVALFARRSLGFWASSFSFTLMSKCQSVTLRFDKSMPCGRDVIHGSGVTYCYACVDKPNSPRNHV